MVSRELSMFLAETIEELTGRLEADIAGEVLMVAAFSTQCTIASWRAVSG